MAVWRTRELHDTKNDFNRRWRIRVVYEPRRCIAEPTPEGNLRLNLGYLGVASRGPGSRPTKSTSIRNNPKLQPQSPQSPNFTLASSSTCIKSYQVHESKEYSRHSIDHKTAWFRCKAKRSVGSFSHNELLTLSQPLLINTPFLCMSPICPRLIHSAQCRFRWTPCTSLA